MSSTENITILGSTGSIGCQTLSVIRENRDRFSVFALSGFSNTDLLVKQAREFSPKLIVVRDEVSAKVLSRECPSCEILFGEEGLVLASTAIDVDIVVGAIVGFACLSPVLAAIKCGKRIALANKECLVGAGEILMHEIRTSGSVLLPIDSEHSSIAQCLQGQRKEEVHSITLTASGGPFLNRDVSTLSKITPEEAVKHPRWSMGAKISVDSATLMNKGLEVIEAFHLFALPAERIGVLIHPESVVHGMVNFNDGAVVACLFSTDMRVPISYALGHASPHSSRLGRLQRNGVSPLSLAALGALHFHEVDTERFPALKLCYEALAQGGASSLVLNASNEIAVNAFLNRQIGFLDIIPLVRETLSRFQNCRVDSMEMVNEVDQRARSVATECLSRFNR